MASTVKATIKTFQISQKEFPNIHGKLNKANAFRHALWNFLIAKYSARFSGDLKSILNWTKTITDWHEEFSPNEELPRIMDYHNNEYGRNFYTQHSELKIHEVVNALKKKLNHSKQIDKVKELQEISEMVYIED